jgi:lipase maturation factor 1
MQFGESANPYAGPATYILSGWLFLRLLGLIYLAAFLSLGSQIKGLVGARGILPAHDFLLSKQSWGAGRFLQFPTLCWWSTSDFFLRSLCRAGTALSLLLVAGVAPVPVLVLLWVLYLSLFTVCRFFLGYQWDILLLETGFLAIFIAPFDLLPAFPPAAAPSPIILWLLWWLTFRLMFSSGIVKLRSGDRHWRNLTALRYHYETQPLPTWTAWYLHQVPGWFHKLSALVMFGIELAAPAFVFAPPPYSYVAGAAFVLLMLLVMGTGNYCFFNLLAIALSTLLFDDAFWWRWFGAIRPAVPFAAAKSLSTGWPGWITFPVALLITLLSVEVIARLLRLMIRWPKLLERLMEWIEPFRLVNGYGLFAVMTVERPEIIVEGSNDGITWRVYEFRWKPGEVQRRPRFVAPHQPRLDWQMWFAALTYYPNTPWFRQFLLRLLRNSPDVLALLRNNPFGPSPPRFVRAVIYDYRFSDFAERRKTGAWWRRERRGLYSPVLSLEEESRARAQLTSEDEG